MLNTDSSQFSHSTAADSVYTSQLDVMRWLKPDPNVVDTMPVQTNPGNSNMPDVPSARALIQSLNKKP